MANEHRYIASDQSALYAAEGDDLFQCTNSKANIADAIFLINCVFKDGASAQCGCDRP
jgi:hypothetical protein